MNTFDLTACTPYKFIKSKKYAILQWLTSKKIIQDKTTITGRNVHNDHLPITNFKSANSIK